MPDQSLPFQGESGGSANSASNTIVEHTTLVSCSTGTVGGLPSPADQSTRFHLVVLPVGQEFLMKQGVPQLITWPISGNLTHHKAFLHYAHIPEG